MLTKTRILHEIAWLGCNINATRTWASWIMRSIPVIPCPTTVLDMINVSGVCKNSFTSQIRVTKLHKLSSLVTLNHITTSRLVKVVYWNKRLDYFVSFYANRKATRVFYWTMKSQRIKYFPRALKYSMLLWKLYV